MNKPVKKILDRLEGLSYWDRRLGLIEVSIDHQPRHLYKYFALNPEDEGSVDYLRDLVVRSRLWLSSPVDFNDPFDMKMQLKVGASGGEIKERLLKVAKRNGMGFHQRNDYVRRVMLKPREEFAKEMQEINERAMSEIGVHSFAIDAKNILMWSHYAKDHTGVCLRFECIRDVKTFVQAIPVEYSEDYPVLNYAKDLESDISKVIVRKSDKWSYEEESRIVKPGDARTYLNFKGEALTGIVFGTNSSGAHRNIVSQLIDERNAFAHKEPVLYQASLHPSSYSLSTRSFER